jgi:hypothetical protein
MVRTFRGVLVALVLGGSLTLVGRSVAADKPCAIATKGNSPVAKACATGGLVDAKKAMRDLVKRGKTAGVKFECDDCHKNDTGYDLTPAAQDNFKKLLAALDAKK